MGLRSIRRTITLPTSPLKGEVKNGSFQRMDCWIQ